MKFVGVISTAVLSLSLGIGLPAYAQQDQHEQEENKDKPAQEQEKDKKAQPEKATKPEDKNARQEDKNTKPEERNAQDQHAQNAKPVQHGRIPDDWFKANFGREHSFRVSEGDYRNHRFQYGGYWFGFESAWPSNWLYTQNVYVVEIDGAYYLCNASYPGVNLTLSVTL
jgi:hypothetical protein